MSENKQNWKYQKYPTKNSKEDTKYHRTSKNQKNEEISQNGNSQPQTSQPQIQQKLSSDGLYPSQGQSQTQQLKGAKNQNQANQISQNETTSTQQFSAHFLQMMSQFPSCFSTTLLPKSSQPSIPTDDCLLKISKLEPKPMRKKSETIKGYGYQEKKTERYYKKEPYDTKAYQDEDQDEPEWMNCDSKFPDLNGKLQINVIILIDFQLNTLQYDFKKTLNIKPSAGSKHPLSPLPPQELFSNVDEILEQKFKEVSQKTISPKNQDLESSSEGELDFEQLLERSQKRNSGVQQLQQVQKVEVKKLENCQIYPQLELKCSQIYSSAKEYNKLKLFIDFTRQITKLDINENIWYYSDPQQKIQGPFSSVDMDVWNLDQYFPPTLQIAWKQNKQFLSILQFRCQPVQVVKLAYLEDEKVLEVLQVGEQEIKKPQGFENYNKSQEQVQNVQIFSIPNYQITHNNFQISQNNFQIPFFTNETPFQNAKNFQQQQHQQQQQTQKQKFNLSSLNNSTEIQNIVNFGSPIITSQNIGGQNGISQIPMNQGLLTNNFMSLNPMTQNSVPQKPMTQNTLNQNPMTLNSIPQNNAPNTNSQNFSIFTQISTQQQPTTQKKASNKSIDVQTQPQLLSDLKVIQDVKNNRLDNISEKDLKKLLGIEKGNGFFDFS